MTQVVGAFAMVAGILTFASYKSPPVWSAPTDGFEITDGNIVDSPAGAPYDWSALFHTVNGNVVSTGVGGFLATSFSADPLAGDPLPSPPCNPGTKGDLTVFTSGGSDKNGDSIDSWTYQSGSIPNAKDDLSNVYAAAGTDSSTGHTDFYFALERTDSNGAAHIDFEFLQNPVGLQQTGTDSSGCPSGHFSGSRTVGDLLVSMNFEQGGSIGTTEVRVWNGTDYVVPGVAPDVHLYENGSGPIACGDWDCRNAAGDHNLTQLPTNAFVEGYLDVTALFPSSAPSCYASFDAKTRSSQAWNSELKDFALASFDTCDARIQVSPPGVNLVGATHTLTAHVDSNPTGAWTPKGGALVTGTISGVGSFVGGTNTCTTDASGNCTLSITSDTPGTSTVNVSSIVEVIPGHSVFRSTATDPGPGGSGPAVKNWVDAYIKVSPNDVNAVNDPHTFTVEYGVLTDGAAGLAIAAPTMTPSLSPSGYTGYSDTCATPTQVNGQNTWRCTITLNSTVAATYTATASGTTTVTMAGGSPGSVTLTRSTSSGQAGPGGNTGATKTYVDARVSVTPDGLNQVDNPNTAAIEDPHTVVATVETNDGGAGWAKAPAGTLVTFGLSGVGSFVNGVHTCATVGTTGQCSIQLNSTVYGTSTVSASASPVVHGVTVPRATATALNTAAGGSGDVTKRWVDASITVTETATNEVSQQHRFTITVTPLVPDGAAVSNVAVTPTVSPVTTVVSNTCGASVPMSGATATCFYTINSAAAGIFDVDASTTVDFTYGAFSQSLTRSTASTAGAYAGPSGNQGATKTYVDARVSITPNGVNPVGDPHTVTAHAEYNDGSGWVDAVGQTVTFTITNTAGATAGFVGGAGTCLTNSSGVCTVQIVSTTAGVTYVSASTSYPVGGVMLNRTSGANPTDPTNVRKEWVAATIGITPSGVNEVRHSHDFTITVTAQSSGAAISIGTVEATVDPATDSKVFVCGTPAATSNSTTETCTLTVNDNDPGVYTANASVTVTIGGVVFNLTTNGQNGNSGPAVKTYVDARITISPDGVNEVNHPHPVTALVEVNDGTHGWVPSGAGVIVALSESGPGSIPASCTTDATGRCTAELTSSSPGLSTVHAATTVSVLGQSLVRATGTELNTYGGGSGDLTKRWVDGVISITPSGVNPVGTTHQFTITAVAMPSGAGEPTFVITPSVTPTPDELVSGCASPTVVEDSGVYKATCTVSITSAQPGLFTANASVTVSVGGVTLTRTTAPDGTRAGPGGSGPATKRYVTASIQVGSSGINEVGKPHTVTGHVKIDDGNGPVNALDSTRIGFKIVSGPGDLSASSCTTAGGTGSCSVTLTSGLAGVTVVDATTIVNVGGVPLTRTTDGTAGNSGSLVKRWIDGSITIGPSAVNPVGKQHTFTVTVTAIPSGGTPVSFDSIVASVAPSPSSLSSTCADPAIKGDTATCTVAINSSIPGTYTANATARITVGGTTIVRSTDSAVAVAGPGGSGPATKAYVATAPGGLAFTGAGLLRGAMIVGVLLMSGLALVIVSRRRGRARA